MFERITFERDVMGGRACVRGMRVSVSVIVGLAAGGATTDEILADYPCLEEEDVREALAYAAWLAREGGPPPEGEAEAHPGDGGEERPDIRKWRDELAFFHRSLSELLEDGRFAGRFVAIRDRQVVDSDDDDVTLVKRMHEKYAGDVVLVAKVEGARPLAEWPSPELRP